MYNKETIYNLATLLGITFDEFSLDDLITGINIELEHGKKNGIINVTDDNLLLTMKIALAHLREFPNYYNKQYGLPMFEEYLKIKQYFSRII